MKSIRTLLPIVAGLVIVLTWFLIQGTAPDDPGRRRTEGLQAVIFQNAALQRDVLQARAGLLHDYDSLARSMRSLLEASADLQAADEVASGDVQLDIDRRIGALAAAIHEQEELVEAFKSDNALLRNSLAYFNHLSSRLIAASDGSRADPAAEIGALTAAMLRFENASLPDEASPVKASLDRLAALPVPEPLAEDVRSLVAHGRLVLETLPEVDERVARLQADSTGAQARALQNAYSGVQQSTAARADLFLALLYVAALVLVAYVAWLFLRLRANARTLQERLEFESLIASISTEFINLPRDRIRAGIEKSLARLADHAGLDRARIVVLRDGEPDVSGSFCIPLQVAGEHLGVLALDAVRMEQDWKDDDIALLRTAAEIFANAIAREQSEHAREELQVRLNQSQRLEAIGTLAGGIAHEFNNILGAVRGYGEMLAALLDDSRARRYVEQITKAGTSFAVYLPRTEEPGIAAETVVEPPLRAGHGETVLIVDDDRPLVLLGEEMLAALGYEPAGFDGSAAALAAFTAEPSRFDLVLTDEIMPGMRGTELAAAMHRIRPDLPLVLMSGYDPPLRPDRLQAAGIRELLKKPLLSRALADCLARQLPAGPVERTDAPRAFHV